eukprot:Gregarina_sp_Poly_1__1848@NODE_1480_length_4035_cov_9_174143_g755_i1_p1_GENE_NODE_1480_length_4035_cov_9_174143_g755_i1NODE_1480_length_4035_cov_9_174143_g755_i1_p1_ORF_typecomplete_len657_score68_39RFX5_N/PF18326_1/0_7RFX5_N/PF18326_1/1_3e03_NODE_1480_length_4035_cov_9_174143_g755_i118223792
MRGIITKQIESVIMEDKRWSCFVGCGCAVLLDWDSMVVCKSDSFRSDYSLFCSNLESCLQEIARKGPSKIQLDASLFVLSFAGSPYISAVKYCNHSCTCGSPASEELRIDEQIALRALNSRFLEDLSPCPKIRSKILEEWNQFLERPEIGEARKKLSKFGFVEIPHFELRPSPIPGNADWISWETKLLTSDDLLYKHIADQWASQFARLCCRWEKPVCAQIETDGFAHSNSLPTESNISGPFMTEQSEEVLNDFQKLYLYLQGAGVMFLEMLKPLEGTDEYRKDLETYLKHYRAGTLRDFKEDLIYIKPDSFNAARNLVAFCDDALAKAAQIHIGFDFEAVIMRLIDMRITAILALSATTEYGLANRCSSHSNVEDFEVWKQELSAIQKSSKSLSMNPRNTQFDEIERQRRVQDIVTLVQDFNPYKDCAACHLDNFKSTRCKLKEISKHLSTRWASRTGQLFVNKFVLTNKLRMTCSPILYHHNMKRLTADDIGDTVNKVRLDLIKLIPKCKSQGDCKPGRLLDSHVLRQLLRWILTEATTEEVGGVVQALQPLLTKAIRDIRNKNLRVAMESKILPNGLTFPEVVASILTLCNSALMITELDKYEIHNICVRLYKLAEMVYMIKTGESRYRAASQRLLLRSQASQDTSTELQAWS